MGTHEIRITFNGVFQYAFKAEHQPDQEMVDRIANIMKLRNWHATGAPGRIDYKTVV